MNDTRFASILPAHVRSIPITIIGCGGTGAAFARQAALTGFDDITLIDFDTIEDHNLGPQGWSVTQLGQPKVTALATELQTARPSITVKPINARWSAAHHLRSVTPIIASCVDSRDTDHFIFNKVYSSLPSPFLYLSPRVRAIDYVLRAVFDAPSRASYLNAHFPDSAVPPEPGSCSVPTTLYGNTALACLMIDNIRRRYTGHPIITYAQRSFIMPPACWLHEEADQDIPTQGAETPPARSDALIVGTIRINNSPIERIDPVLTVGTLHESEPTQIPADLPF